MKQSIIPDAVWKKLRRPHDRRRREWIADRPRVERALDVGCGHGYMTSAIPADEIVGCDIRAESLAVARGFLADNGFDIEFVQADAYALPFPGDSFDAVYCLETLEHLDSPQRAAKELMRVCRDVIYVTVPAYGHMRGTPGHIQDFTPEALAALFGGGEVFVEEPFSYLTLSLSQGVAPPGNRGGTQGDRIDAGGTP